MTSRLSFMAMVLALLTACANTTTAPSVSVGADGQVPSANQFLGQLSLPTGARLLSDQSLICLLYTSPSPRDRSVSRMPSSA